MVVAFLLTGHYWLFLFNAPMFGWSMYELYTLPPGNMGIFDPTEIHNRGMVRKHLKDCIIYCAFFLIFFFIYLYWWEFPFNDYFFLIISQAKYGSKYPDSLVNVLIFLFHLFTVWLMLYSKVTQYGDMKTMTSSRNSSFEEADSHYMRVCVCVVVDDYFLGTVIWSFWT